MIIFMIIFISFTAKAVSHNDLFLCDFIIIIVFIFIFTFFGIRRAINILSHKTGFIIQLYEVVLFLKYGYFYVICFSLTSKTLRF